MTHRLLRVVIICTKRRGSPDPFDWVLGGSGVMSEVQARTRAQQLLRQHAHVKVFAEKTLLAEFSSREAPRSNNPARAPLRVPEKPRLHNHRSLQPPRETARSGPATVANPGRKCPRPESDYSTCPVCNCRIRADRLSKHLSKVHKGGGRETGQPSRALKVSAWPRQTGFTGTPQFSRPPRMPLPPARTRQFGRTLEERLPPLPASLEKAQGAGAEVGRTSERAPESRQCSSSRPCSCQGSNANCFRCYGTGIVDSNSISSPQTGTRVLGPFDIAMPTPAPARRRRPVLAASAHPPAKPARPTKEYPRCPDCNCCLRADRMSKHLSKVHKRPSEGKRRGHILGPPWHGRRTISHSAGLSDPASEPAIPSSERNLDATKDFWQFREHGRFGSASSHDDYSDESDA